MAPLLYRTSVYQGEPWSEDITCLESQTPRVGEDLTGYTFVGQVRRTPESPTVLATIAITLDTDEETGTLCVVGMSLTSAQTALFPAEDEVVFDVRGTKVGDDTATKVPIRGTMAISQRVTR